MIQRTLLLLLLSGSVHIASAENRILKMSQLYADLDFVGQLKLKPGEQRFPFTGITHDWECDVGNPVAKTAITIDCRVKNGKSPVNAGSMLYCDAVDTFTVDSVDFQCLTIR